MAEILDPVEAVSWLWRGYAVGLNVTVYLAGVLALGWMLRRCDALLRAAMWTAALLGTIAVVIACAPWYGSGRELMPMRFDGSELTGVLASPLEVLAAAGTGARYAAAIGADNALGGQPLLIGALGLAGIWMLGTIVVLGRLVRGWYAVSRLRRTSSAVRDPEWRGALRQLRMQLGILRPVDLRAVEQPGTPLTWGTLRPVILLPAGYQSWPIEHRRAVLLHELAHVQRNDCLVQMAAQVLGAALWFHPLIWVAVAQLHRVREEACDEIVVRAGIARSDYAECLLRVCDLARVQGAAASVAVTAGMVRGPRLKYRLHRILGGARDTRRPLRVAAATAVVVLTTFAATLRVGPSQARVIAALDHPSWQHRALAALSVAHGASRQEAAALEARLVRDPDPRVRHAVELFAGKPH